MLNDIQQFFPIEIPAHKPWLHRSATMVVYSEGNYVDSLTVFRFENGKWKFILSLVFSVNGVT